MTVTINAADTERKSVQAGFAAIWPISVSSKDNTVRFTFDWTFGPDA